MRYFIEVAYHGALYHGWQVQPNAETVQEKLNFVLSKLLRAEIEITGSGRTDTGVHCSQQFAHFDYDDEIVEKDLLHKANSFLPPDISLKSIRRVTDEAHARFDAVSRSYEYKITLHKNPFLQGLAYTLRWTPDLKLLNQAASVLPEYTDFEAFSKIHSDVHTHNCDIMEAYWVQNGDDLTFHIKANRFLRGMVRIITGNLLQVGLGKLSIEEMRDIIEKKDRKRAARFLVPGHGLYLNQVTYPESIWL
ncbi:tRNA pseudouridine(38-40) synthase TruA [Limibacter armeniacum]|uniref:tRNA pseudouridine(38-40) synthase TruA n=1 Tax=Limibacter armeniacum TaxID=466084 RepID=UPI002FE5A66B